MSSLIISGISYQHLPNTYFAKRNELSKSFSLISRCLAKQVDELLEKSEIPKEAIDRHFLCSTMIELPFTSGKVSWQDIAKIFSNYGSHQPTTFVNAYECASWGYSLRHYLKFSNKPYLLVSILDANFYDFEFWRYNDHWENSGFGMATVLLEIENHLSDELLIGATTTHNSMAEFATVVRRTAAQKEGITLSMPFFPSEIQKMFEKLLQGQAKLPDLHAKWGHCFGADPWISILCHGMENEINQRQEIMACSYALNGYYALANVVLKPETSLTLKTEFEYD